MSGASLISCMGSDLTVVNAARVSFGKQSTALTASDIKLIHYLARHKHWSPFAHPQLTFHIKAPIFVARQLAKHQVGLAWNEISRRYVDSPPEIWYPATWRERAEDKKQGSKSSASLYSQGGYTKAVQACIEEYNNMLAWGVCPEQARAVLPLALMTEWYWTGSLYAFSNMCHLRSSPSAQVETKIISDSISTNIQPLFPNAWEALQDASH